MLSILSVLLRKIRTSLLPLAAALAIFAGGSAAQAAGDGYIFTDINGAQTQIDGAPHSSQFTISATSSTVLKGGDFTMKAGSDSTASVTLSLYELATNGSKTPITSKTYANGTAFCAAHGGTCTQFAAMFFDFPAPVTMVPGKTYFAELTSTAADRQSEAYFIKGGKTACYVATSSGTLIPGTNCSIGQVNPSPTPLLSVSKSGPASIDPNVSTVVDYDLTVTNSGSGAAATAQVKDQLPAGLTYTGFSGTGWSCSNASGLVTCNYTGSIAVNASSTVTISTTIGSTGTSINNIASVGQTGGSAIAPNSCTADNYTNGACDSFSSSVAVNAPYLAISLAGPTPALQPGGNSTYDVTVTNTGNAAATGPVHAYFTVPAHTTYVSSGSTDWSCATVGSPVTSVDCTYTGGNYAAAAVTSFPVEVQVDSDVQGTDEITADAYVNRDGSPAETAPATCSATETYDCASLTDTANANFTMDKSPPTPALKVGQESVYELTMTTDGTSVPAEMMDQLPASLKFVDATGDGWTCDVDPAKLITCTKTMTAGTTEVVSVTVTPDPSAAGEEAKNYASVGPAGHAPEPGESCTTENCDSDSSVINAAGFTVEKSAPSPALKVSQESTYTLTVTTDGEGVPAEVKDQLPASLTLVSAGGNGWTCSEDGSNLVTCSKTISSGTTEEIPVVVVPTAGSSGESVTNYASAGTEGAAPTPGPSCDGPNCDSNTATIDGIQFTVDKSAPSPALKVSQESTYTLTVTTDGTEVAAEVKDQLPASLTYLSAGGNGWICAVDGTNLVTCNKTISSGTDEEIPVVVVPAAAASGESITNYASAGEEGAAPAPGPSCDTANCDSNTAPVTPAGFTVDKSAPVPALKVGQQSAYTLTVTTDGTGVAAEVKDQLPAGLSFVRAEGDGWSCGVDGSSLVTCSKSISSGSSEEVVVTVVPESSISGQSVTNYASSGPAGEAPAPGPNCTTPNCDQNSSEVNAAGFTVSKSAPSPGLQVGQQSVYTLTVETDGTDVAAEVKDQLPAGLTFVSASGSGWSCNVDDNHLVTCNKTISSGNAEEIEVTVRTEASAVGQNVTNYASAGPQGGAPQPGPSCSDADCDSNEAVVAPPKFTLTKSAPVPGLEVNRNSTYTLTVTTDGMDVGAEVKDQLPAGLAFVSASGTGWTCAVDAGNLVTCNKTISSDATEVIEVTVNTKAAVNNQSVTNYASAGLDGAAPQPGPSCAGDGCADSTAKVADIREKIKKAVEDDVQAYLGARIDQLIGSFDSQSRLSRFRDTACGVNHDMSMSGDATSRSQNMAANGTFTMKGGIVPTADVPDQCNSRTNVWAQLDIGYVNGLQDSSATGGLITVGAEYLIADNFLAGVRLSMDYTDANFDSEANSDISGYGWLAGPYISAEIANNVYLDGFLGYGTSWNDYSGNYQDLDLSGDFTTQRVAGYLNLSGVYETGPVALTPLVGVSFGKEWSDSFDVHNSSVGDTNIDSQDAGLGRLKGRVEAAYTVTDEVNEQLQVFVAPQVTYDFLRNAGPDGELLLGDSLWRGGVEGGFRFAHDNFGASLLVGYDGIGVSDWNAYHGQLQLNYTW